MNEMAVHAPKPIVHRSLRMAHPVCKCTFVLRSVFIAKCYNQSRFTIVFSQGFGALLYGPLSGAMEMLYIHLTSTLANE